MRSRSRLGHWEPRAARVRLGQEIRLGQPGNADASVPGGAQGRPRHGSWTVHFVPSQPVCSSLLGGLKEQRAACSTQGVTIYLPCFASTDRPGDELAAKEGLETTRACTGPWGGTNTATTDRCSPTRAWPNPVWGLEETSPGQAVPSLPFARLLCPAVTPRERGGWQVWPGLDASCYCRDCCPWHPLPTGPRTCTLHLPGQAAGLSWTRLSQVQPLPPRPLGAACRVSQMSHVCSQANQGAGLGSLMS